MLILLKYLWNVRHRNLEAAILTFLFHILFVSIVNVSSQAHKCRRHPLLIWDTRNNEITFNKILDFGSTPLQGHSVASAFHVGTKWSKWLKLSSSNIGKRLIIIVVTFKRLLKKRERPVMMIQLRVNKFHNGNVWVYVPRLVSRSQSVFCPTGMKRSFLKRLFSMMIIFLDTVWLAQMSRNGRAKLQPKVLVHRFGQR